MVIQLLKRSVKLTLYSGIMGLLFAGAGIVFSSAFAISNAKADMNSDTANGVAADNSKANKRTTSDQQLTSQDQSNGKSDTEITRAIRQSLVKDSQLSTYAHNVKIITQDGKVTLKGPVRSEQEKSIIAKKANKMIAGAQNVENQLEISHNS